MRFSGRLGSEQWPQGAPCHRAQRYDFLTASRLEVSAKELDAYLVASEIAAQRAGVDLARVVRRELTLRGRSVRLKAVVFSNAQGPVSSAGKEAP